MSETIRGTRPRGKPRAPRVRAEERACAEPGCPTKLSRYNTKKHCYAHAPLRFPRVRGREVVERPNQA